MPPTASPFRSITRSSASSPHASSTSRKKSLPRTGVPRSRMFSERARWNAARWREQASTEPRHRFSKQRQDSGDRTVLDRQRVSARTAIASLDHALPCDELAEVGVGAAADELVPRRLVRLVIDAYLDQPPG